MKKFSFIFKTSFFIIFFSKAEDIISQASDDCLHENTSSFGKGANSSQESEGEEENNNDEDVLNLTVQLEEFTVQFEELMKQLDTVAKKSPDTAKKLIDYTKQKTKQSKSSSWKLEIVECASLITAEDTYNICYSPALTIWRDKNFIAESNWARLNKNSCNFNHHFFHQKENLDPYMPAGLPASPECNPLFSTGYEDKNYEVRFTNINEQISNNKASRFKGEVKEPFTFPYSVHGRLVIKFQKGNEIGYGSGTLIGPAHVLTAAHNVYSKKYGWAVSIQFCPAQSQNKTPIGISWGIGAVVDQNWKNFASPSYDYALIVLDRDMGTKAGWYGIKPLTTNDFKERFVNITGYPALEENSTHIQMWSDGRCIKSASDHFLEYYNGTDKGQSGASHWGLTDDKKGPYIWGIHTTGGKEENGEAIVPNSGIRITKGIFEKIYSLLMNIKLITNPQEFFKKSEI